MREIASSNELGGWLSEYSGQRPLKNALLVVGVRWAAFAWLFAVVVTCRSPSELLKGYPSLLRRSNT
jgi:hypothetical protein